MKKNFLIFLFVAMAGVMAASGQAYASAYMVDSVYETATPDDDWLENTPTLTPGTTYNISIEGTGNPFIDSGTTLDSDARLGLFVDFEGTRTIDEWDSFTEDPVVSGAASGSPLGPEIPVLSYTLNGSFTTPSVFNASQGSALAFIHGDETGDPSLSELLDFDILGISDVSGIPNIAPFSPARTFNVNLASGAPVAPEPAGMTLLGLGLAGAGLFARKRRSLKRV